MCLARSVGNRGHMYKVKAIARNGPIIFACGTIEQAFGKVLELIARGLHQIRVVDPAGGELAAEEFKRRFFDEGV